MFGKWKKLYEVTETRLRIQIEHNRELTKYQQLYEYLPDNIENIHKKYKDQVPNIYIINNQIYYIVEKYLNYSNSEDYSIDMFTYNLTKASQNPVIKLSAEVSLYDYLEKPLKRALLDNIDVFNEPRCGHGSYALERFIYLMKNDAVDYIEGKLLLDSPIGIENLREFYRKNKFDVSGSSFKLVLNKDK